MEIINNGGGPVPTIKKYGTSDYMEGMNAIASHVGLFPGVSVGEDTVAGRQQYLKKAAIVCDGDADICLYGNERGTKWCLATFVNEGSGPSLVVYYWG